MITQDLASRTGAEDKAFNAMSTEQKIEYLYLQSKMVDMKFGNVYFTIDGIKMHVQWMETDYEREKERKSNNFKAFLLIFLSLLASIGFVSIVRMVFA